MMRIDMDLLPAKPAQPSATLAYLESRVREEADAAARAGSMEATLAHVVLATRYAERFTECSGQSASSAGHAWVDDHRVW